MTYNLIMNLNWRIYSSQFFALSGQAFIEKNPIETYELKFNNFPTQTLLGQGEAVTKNLRKIYTADVL